MRVWLPAIRLAQQLKELKMELRFADNLQNSGSTPADPPQQMGTNADADKQKQLQKQTIEWIAISAQSRFRKAWSGTRES
jgi:hypothetical protein